MPLHYSLRALCVSHGLKAMRGEVENNLGIVSGFLSKGAGKREDDPLFTAIENVRTAITSSGTRLVTKSHPARPGRMRR